MGIREWIDDDPPLLRPCPKCGTPDVLRHEQLCQPCSDQLEAAGLPDSGARENMPTGAVRDTRKGKGRYDLLPPEALEAYARHMEAGCAKYGDRNWEKGQPLSRYCDSALRHMFKWMAGGAEEDHLAAAFWNIGAALTTRARVKAGKLPSELDDMPPKGDK